MMLIVFFLDPLFAKDPDQYLNFSPLPDSTSAQCNNNHTITNQFGIGLHPLLTVENVIFTFKRSQKQFLFLNNFYLVACYKF